VSLDLSNDELRFLVEATNAAQITGAHARLVAGVQEKLVAEAKRRADAEAAQNAVEALERARAKIAAARKRKPTPTEG